MKMGKYVSKSTGKKYIAIQVDIPFKYKNGDGITRVDIDDWIMIGNTESLMIYDNYCFNMFFEEYIEPEYETKASLFWVEGTTLMHNLPEITSDEMALELSIKKWEFIRDWIEENNKVIMNGYKGDSCALCIKYIGHNGSCNRCPVDTNGHSDCVGTPFFDYTNNVFGKENIVVAYKAANDEVEFLQKLLKEQQTEKEILKRNKS